MGFTCKQIQKHNDMGSAVMQTKLSNRLNPELVPMERLGSGC